MRGTASVRVIYFGFNDPRLHARGVEFVIRSQAKAAGDAYYVFLGKRTECFRWGRIVCISVRKTLFWPLVLNLIVRKLRNGHSRALVHSHNYLMALALMGRVDVFTVHDGLGYLKNAMGHRGWVYEFIEAIVYLRARKLHFVSFYSKSKAHWAKGRRPSVVIYNTCPRDEGGARYLRGRRAVNGARARQYVLVTRSIEQRAGIDLVLDFARLLGESKYADMEIVIAGKGPLLEHYRQAVISKGHKNVSFLGYVPDEVLEQLYANAALVLVPALYGEGFGLPVIEGYYFDRVVLASNVCALPEVIIDKGYLFSNSAESIIERFELALESGLSGEGARRKYYDERFGAERYVAQIGSMYDELRSD